MQTTSNRASSVRTFSFDARSTHERFPVHQRSHRLAEGRHHLHRGSGRNEDIQVFVTEFVDYPSFSPS